jgi:DNA-binding NarL/FixJ family response regulator
MLKILLADDQAIFRAGIAKVLAVEDDIRIVAQAQTAEQMTSAIEKMRPNILVVSSRFHVDLRGVANSAAKAKGRLVVVAENGENAAQYLNIGAAGVVYRNITGTALVECVRTVARGERWIQDANVAAEISENDMVAVRVRDRLTTKELHIIALIVQGYRNKEIATQLGTTEQVIKNYLRNVYDKIGVSDRLELALFTIHHRLLAEAAAATAAATAAASAASSGSTSASA